MLASFNGCIQFSHMNSRGLFVCCFGSHPCLCRNDRFSINVLEFLPRSSYIFPKRMLEAENMLNREQTMTMLNFGLMIRLEIWIRSETFLCLTRISNRFPYRYPSHFSLVSVIELALYDHALGSVIEGLDWSRTWSKYVMENCWVTLQRV